MTGAWHGGKGSDPRKPSISDAEMKERWDAIDWSARERESDNPLFNGDTRAVVRGLLRPQDSVSCTLDHPSDWPCAICDGAKK